MPENKSHVAWADRLGLNKIWHDAINDCRITYGTSEYRRAVFGLQQLIIDIKGEGSPKLRTNINTYKNTIWEDEVNRRLNEWKKRNPYPAHKPSSIQFAEEQIRNDMLEDLFTYMIQLLEDNGFGFYKAEYDGKVETW